MPLRGVGLREQRGALGVHWGRPRGAQAMVALGGSGGTCALVGFWWALRGPWGALSLSWSLALLWDGSAGPLCGPGVPWAAMGVHRGASEGCPERAPREALRMLWVLLAGHCGARREALERYG